MKNWWQSIKAGLGFNHVDFNDTEALKKALLLADFGTLLTNDIIERWSSSLKGSTQHDSSTFKETLSKILDQTMLLPHPIIEPGQFITLWGVNGVGKTTTAAKLAYHFKNQGSSVLLAACDTFRAAATEQLAIWAQRVGCDIVRQGQNADPAAIAFDALSAQRSRKIDYCIADTAGRIHHSQQLQQQSQKIIRVLQKQDTNAPHHRWLVLDAHLGQNSLEQARHFHEAVVLNGLIVTKWDGSAKAGILAQIVSELKIPILFIGTGEGLTDLECFDSSKYVDKILA